MPPRPTNADLEAAAGRTVPDVIAPGLRVLFCGINPSLYTAAVGHHFGRPGNRFWQALHDGGFTERRLRPDEQEGLLAHGLGITNILAHATRAAADLSADELRAGAAALTAKVRRVRPRWLAVLCVGAYRTGFGRPQAQVGPQGETVGGVPVWVLPNPSGLNAHYPPAALAAVFAAFREAVEQQEARGA